MRERPAIEMPAGGIAGWDGVEGVLGLSELLAAAGVGIVVTGVVTGVAGFGGETVAGLAGGIEGGGMRVTGVAIGARI